MEMHSLRVNDAGCGELLDCLNVWTQLIGDALLPGSSSLADEVMGRKQVPKQCTNQQQTCTYAPGTAQKTLLGVKAFLITPTYLFSMSLCELFQFV